MISRLLSAFLFPRRERAARAGDAADPYVASAPIGL